MDYYPESKVYHDGSHYIGIPHTTNPTRKRPKVAEELVEVVDEPKQETPVDVGEQNKVETSEEILPSFDDVQEKQKEKLKRVSTRSEIFNELYKANKAMKKRELRKLLIDNMRPYFKTYEATKNFVLEKMERKMINAINCKKRFCRKAYLNNFNYFVTFTYDSAKNDEVMFRKKLLKCLGNFHTRRDWLYMGVWERSKTGRLHFHALVKVPDGTMAGELIAVNDYSFDAKKRQNTMQNTYFNERFGRTEFKEINQVQLRNGSAIQYILKYITKTNEKIVYSRGTPMYWVTDIMDEDVVCRTGLEDKKLLLFDNFNCWDEGCLIGDITEPETKKQLKTSNI